MNERPQHDHNPAIPHYEPELIHIGARLGSGPVISGAVRDLPVRLKKIVTSDDGKLQILLEAEHLAKDHLPKVQDMLALQQDTVLLTLKGVQMDFFR